MPPAAPGPISRVGVVGLGLMGSGIAQVSAAAGFHTTVRDISDDVVEAGLEGILKRLDRQVEKGEISGSQRDDTFARIHGTTELAALADSDLVIEAVVEELEIKIRIWRELDDHCREDAIFASNTSSLTISEMAATSRRPERVIGLHFFNPVPVMRLVEVIRTLVTEEDVVQRALAFVQRLGKEVVECRDRSGFVVNFLLVPFMMDAIRAVENEVASVEEIDRGMRLGAGHPMGPLTLCDFVGLDTLERIGAIMFREYGEVRYTAPPLLKRMVALGFTGRKGGRGFYDYAVDPPRPAPGIP